MKILVITRNAWDDTNAIGNTLSNFFGGLEDTEYASIYFRSARPNNKVCKRYFRTSETEVIKKWFQPGKIGKSFLIDDNKTDSSSDRKEKRGKKIIRVIQKYGIKMAYKLSDSIWYSQKWINNNLREYIESFSPDIVFTFVRSAPQYYLTVKYLRENFGIPLFTWIADDEYTALSQKGLKKGIRNLEYILRESVEVRGCSQELCDYYNSIFSCKATPLYKGCDLSASVKKNVNDTLKIVYAGNLLYGRLEILNKIADTLEQLSNDGIKISFDIYSNTELLTSEIDENFGKRRCTFYKGKRDYDVIKNELSSADIVLHVESFEESEILKTKYSFSTKIIDYMQCGSAVLAVGPSEVSSMKYLSSIPGVFSITDLKLLNTELYDLIKNSDELPRRAAEIREFAINHHDLSVITKDLTETVERIVKGGI